MFIEALFIIARTSKQPNCPSTDKWTKRILLSDKKRNKMISFAAPWMGLEIIILSEVRQRQIPYDITYMWNIKYGTRESICETETDSQT